MLRTKSGLRVVCRKSIQQRLNDYRHCETTGTYHPEGIGRREWTGSVRGGAAAPGVRVYIADCGLQYSHLSGTFATQW
jgi:hypothetical protein